MVGQALTVGMVHFSVKTQEHTDKRHPTDFNLSLQHLAQMVTRPDYIGQSPHQPDGFELIGEVRAGGELILVVIYLRPDRRRRYFVKSTYRIDRNKLKRRLRKGFVAKA